MVYARLLLGGSAFLFALATLSWALLSCNKITAPTGSFSSFVFYLGVTTAHVCDIRDQ